MASCNRLQEAEARVCVVEVRMPSDADRQRVLTANREAAIRSVRRGDAFIVPLEEPGLMIISRDAECAAARNLNFQAAGFDLDESVQELDQANALLALRMPRPRAHLEERECIVRFRERDEEQFARLTEILLFVGLRGAQVEAADGNIYVAADEPCSLLNALVTETYEEAEGGIPHGLQECRHVSLAGCGFGVEILTP